MLQNTEQTKEKMCVALFNKELHANGICPGNHDVAYEGDNIFYMDGERVEKFGLDQEADERIESDHVVLYSSLWNTYVLAPF